VILLVFLLWYCFDDWLATQSGNPALGNVPLGFWLFVFFVFWFVLPSFGWEDEYSDDDEDEEENPAPHTGA